MAEEAIQFMTLVFNNSVSDSPAASGSTGSVAVHSHGVTSSPPPAQLDRPAQVSSCFVSHTCSPSVRSELELLSLVRVQDIQPDMRSPNELFWGSILNDENTSPHQRDFFEGYG